MNEKYKQWLRDQYDKEMKDGINAIEFLKEWAGTGHEDLADGALRKSRYCAARAPHIKWP